MKINMEKTKRKTKWQISLADVVLGVLTTLGASASIYVIGKDLMQLETFSTDGFYCILQDPRLIMAGSTTVLTGAGWSTYRRKNKYNINYSK